MSERAAHATSAPPGNSYMPIETMYRLTRGVESDWGIEGYYVAPKSAVYKPIKKTFPKSQRRTFFEDAKKKEKDPGPGAYARNRDQKADPKNKNLDPEWATAQGAFKKCARNTEIDVIIKTAKKFELPGPGTYKPTPKYSQAQVKKDSSNADKEVPLGKIDKAEGLNYLTTVQFMANTTPSSWEYMKAPQVVEKVMEMTKPRTTSLKWVKPPPPKKKPSKDDPEVKLGPGAYNPFGEPAPTDFKKVKPLLTEERKPQAFFPLSKAPNAIVAASKAAKYVACVGMYDTRREDEKRRDKANVKSSAAPFLTQEKRIDDPKKGKKAEKTTPGPGAYDVLPPMEYDIMSTSKKK
mmetsp:Transcript_15702/g.28653  ORF Transcript_15702/g.28653 Transcript_15702/m.28653 type:complete len:350 (-) Transcript_15702:2457-3506(-)